VQLVAALGFRYVSVIAQKWEFVRLEIFKIFGVVKSGYRVLWIREWLLLETSWISAEVQ